MTNPLAPILQSLSPDCRALYEKLCVGGDSNRREGPDNTCWYETYLDNSRGDESVNEFRARLAVLSKAGIYKVIDGYCWGEVRIA